MQQKGLLETIDGAGEVEVMITLESCYENVYLKDKNLKTTVLDIEDGVSISLKIKD